MVLGQLYYMIQIEKTTTTTQNDFDVTSYNSNNNTLLFAFLDLLSKFWFFLLSQLLHSKVSSDSELLVHGSRDDDVIRRDEVKMMMEKLGFFCSSESEELEENYGFNEFSGLFEEEEPSLEEVKQAFDVFDENGDGFIDEWELKRVLCVLGLKEEASQIENCQKMIRKFDENGDGRIDFNEFVKVMENSFC